jgi:hypothetical protein
MDIPFLFPTYARTCGPPVLDVSCRVRTPVDEVTRSTDRLVVVGRCRLTVRLDISSRWEG